MQTNLQTKARVFDVATSIVSERIVEGESIELITRQLESEGLVVLSISTSLKPPSAKNANRFDTALFCEELRTLLSSGMSLVEAMDALCSRRSDESKYFILSEMKQRLLEGKSFSVALEMNPFPFSALLIASVRASERTSRLDEALDEFIAYDKVGQELRKKIVSALIYPALVVGFGFVVSLFMIAFVVPRFSKVYEDFKQTLSLPTLFLMKLGQFSENNLIFLIIGFVASVATCFILVRNGRLKKIALTILGKWSVTSHYLRQYQMARIYQTVAMLLKGGYTLVDAIPLAVNLAFETKLRDQIVAAHQSILEGKRLSTSFAKAGLTDGVAERLLQVGERSGNLSKILDIIAQTYRQEFMLFMERMTRLAEPVLLMAVGLMIGAIIVMMYMPVFDLAGGM